MLSHPPIKQNISPGLSGSPLLSPRPGARSLNLGNANRLWLIFGSSV